MVIATLVGSAVLSVSACDWSDDQKPGQSAASLSVSESSDALVEPADDLAEVIGGANDATVAEVVRISQEFYSDVPFDEVEDAVAQASPDELSAIRDVLAGTEDASVLQAILAGHGLAGGGERSAG